MEGSEPIIYKVSKGDTYAESCFLPFVYENLNNDKGCLFQDHKRANVQPDKNILQYSSIRPRDSKGRFKARNYKIRFSAIDVVNALRSGRVINVNPTILCVNLDGLNMGHLSKKKKMKFKDNIKSFRRKILPELASPFTGRIELHCNKRILKSIKFIPKQ
jgi:hypothetical protein